MRKSASLGWTTVFGLALTGLTGASSPPVSISLETSWPAPPLILEILETVYDESPASYFPLLHLLSSLPNTSTPSTILSSTLDLISSYSLLPSPSALSTFHLALSLHSTAPRIEAEYSWYESAVRPLESQLGVEGCEGWVEWRGKGFCGVEELRRDMELSIEEHDHHGTVQPTPQPFDHTSSSSSASPTSPKAIIYYTPSSPSASSLLNYLGHHASLYPDFVYAVRYQPPSDRSVSGEGTRKTPLAGWGVEMVLKKTDYLVVDDRASSASAAKSQSGTGKEVSKVGNESGVFSHVLGEDPWSDLATPLTTEEVKDLGLKATALIMSSDEPLEALTHLSQDFPKYSAALARGVEVPENIRDKSRTIAVRGRAGPTIYVNGRAFGSDLNAYSLLKTIRDERHLVLSLTSLGLTPKQAVDLISDPAIGQAQTEDEAGEGIVDASDRFEGGKVITWWNDIEKDKRYKNWPVHIQGYMRHLYPGQFHTVRRNTWNLVFVLDLASVPSLDIITSAISPMIQRGLPIRFGVVPMFDPAVDDTSAKMAKLFHYSVNTFGRGATRDFFAALVGVIPSTLTAPGTVTLEHARKAYDILAAESTKAALPFDEVIASEDYDHHLAQTAEYMSRLLATKEESKSGHLFINGKHTLMGGHWTAVVQSEMASQLGYLQEQLMLGDNPDDLSTYFYDLPSTSRRRSKLIVPGAGETKLRSFNLIDLFEDDVTKKLTSEFVYADGDRGAPITMWVVGDLDTAEGKRVVTDALKHLQTPECASRLGFVHVPNTNDDAPRDGGYRLSTVIYQLYNTSALSNASPQHLLELFSEVASPSDASNLEDQPCFKEGLSEEEGRTCLTEKLSPEEAEKWYEEKPLRGLTFGGWVTGDVAASAQFWKVGSKVANKMSLKDGSPHLLVNGRLVGPLTERTFPIEDFDALEVYEHRKRVKPVIDLLKTMYDDITVFDRPTLGNMIAMTTSVITAAYKPVDAEGIFTPLQTSRGRYYRKLDNGDMSFTIGDLDTAILQVAAVMDPLSEHAQRWSTLLQTLSEMENVAVSVYLEPEPMMTEVKLKRFYRASIPSQVAFDIDGEVIAPGVVFDNLPSTPIYTLGLDTPSSWIVSPKTSPYDLDNLVLSQVHEPLHVLFQLKQLLIEGHAREGDNVPPRGLQLQLTTNGLEAVVAADTQVMANLGYLQFRATPGVYDLSIRPGRGREVFELESVGNGGWDGQSVNVTGPGVMLASFEGTTIFPRFARKEGMERADVLAPEAAVRQDESLAGAVLSKMKSMVGLSTNVVSVQKSRHADINIFTVASGLLYERFASIMILSVMRHTKSTVKFWFIENFLSPSFIAFIPKLAEEYGFQYELVTYKWPHWLRAQTEKQRIIWAYKILFLDVLFPMDLDKVIFVDADQIVRTDMKELVDVDLHGRVYGYAPMGNSREEMEGFRFWKTGYWKDALRGRPYHISALYVVDLKRFRQLATGDRLRGQYHALSADPNSLANLDQDLPNSMQDTIPIWTLDQDWLWCQTWCSDESLKTAKTIDLCQNPLTKEPKLVRARQIPEWDVYDREIAAFAARTSGDGDESGALAGSVDDLASEVVGGGETTSAVNELDVGEEENIEEQGETGRLEDEL
ncbi:hypothetical protein CI109_100209 [Kwoniella shandongensis]|uniref:UDP-glucose:glycoprotein glucosyltransferase n=1 Tax=Kwoniella shandongensis TaxID=1734106 RepID=A0A5M6BTV3_9TREE|nr:uncharacterized protein CI109_006256 [Kwoniella shandongensis]KAA5525452.1 hypothetical protein CI109_006256 [Kwoniella shandongensis]